jgi:hypothetical protein
LPLLVTGRDRRHRLSNAAKYGEAGSAPRVEVFVESLVGTSDELEDVRSDF